MCLISILGFMDKAHFSSGTFEGTSTKYLAWAKPSSLRRLTWWFEQGWPFAKVFGSSSEPLLTHVSNGNNQVLKMKAAL